MKGLRRAIKQTAEQWLRDIGLQLLGLFFPLQRKSDMPVDVMNLNTINPREERYLHGTMTIVTLCVRVGSMAEKCCSRLKDCWQETQLGKKASTL